MLAPASHIALPRNISEQNPIARTIFSAALKKVCQLIDYLFGLLIPKIFTHLFLEHRDLDLMRDVNYGNGRKIKSCDRRGWPEMPSAEEERKDRPVKILSPLPRSLPSLSAVCLLIVLAGYCLNGQRFSMRRALRISIFPSS